MGFLLGLVIGIAAGALTTIYGLRVVIEDLEAENKTLRVRKTEATTYDPECVRDE